MDIGRVYSSGTDASAAGIASAVRTGGGRMLALLAAVLVVLAATAVAAAGLGDAGSASDGRSERADVAAAREAPGALVYYGRARMPFVRRPAINSRSSHPAARSPGRCTSRSLPSA